MDSLASDYKDVIIDEVILENCFSLTPPDYSMWICTMRSLLAMEYHDEYKEGLIQNSEQVSQRQNNYQIFFFSSPCTDFLFNYDESKGGGTKIQEYVTNLSIYVHIYIYFF